MRIFRESKINLGSFLELAKCLANSLLLILARDSAMVFSMIACTRRRLSGSAARKSNLKFESIASALCFSTHTHYTNQSYPCSYFYFFEKRPFVFPMVCLTYLWDTWSVLHRFWAGLHERCSARRNYSIKTSLSGWQPEDLFSAPYFHLLPI